MDKLFGMSRIVILLLCLGSIEMSLDSANAQNDDAALKIGSKAPDLDIEHWFSDHDGLFPHTTGLEAGKIYVIEFWATWCKPCVNAMPRIAELQQRYIDDNIQFISISDEDRETIEEFLQRKIPGDLNKTTYGQLTRSYCLTSDPDKSVKKDYFRAAKQFGVPCAFIVGRTGLVEWIGNTILLDEPLEKIRTDTWDRDAFVATFEQEQEIRRRAILTRRQMIKSMAEFQTLVRAERLDQAVEIINEMLNEKDYASNHGAFRTMRLNILIRGSLPGLDIALNEFTEQNKYDAQQLNTYAWNIFLKFQAGEQDDPEVLKQAKKMAEVAVKAAPESGAILDTLAHLIYIVDGDVDKALAVQQNAVEHGGRQKNELMPFLRQLEAEKRSRDKRPEQ